MSYLRRSCDVDVGLPACTWMVHAGAFFMRTEPELPLKSRYVKPGRLQENGYHFRYAKMDKAIDNLIT